MKKLISLSVATFVLAMAVKAQTGEEYVKADIHNLNKEKSEIRKEKKKEKKELRKLIGNEVSALAKEQFKNDFGDIPVTQWERIENFDEASFTRNGEEVSAFYDEDAKLVGTTSPRTFSDLPSRSQKYINDHFAGYSVGDVLFFDDNEQNETDMVLFNQQFEDEDSYFVELKKENKKIVLQVDMDGQSSVFARLE